jgi:hypothetical protein
MFFSCINSVIYIAVGHGSIRVYFITRCLRLKKVIQLHGQTENIHVLNFIKNNH